MYFQDGDQENWTKFLGSSKVYPILPQILVSKLKIISVKTYKEEAEKNIKIDDLVL